MLLPSNDKVKEDGVRRCIIYVRDFFLLTFPEKSEEEGIDLSDENLFTMYALAKSDDDYIQLVAKQWGVDIDAEAVELNKPANQDKLPDYNKEE